MSFAVLAASVLPGCTDGEKEDAAIESSDGSGGTTGTGGTAPAGGSTGSGGTGGGLNPFGTGGESPSEPATGGSPSGGVGNPVTSSGGALVGAGGSGGAALGSGGGVVLGSGGDGIGTGGAPPDPSTGGAPPDPGTGGVPPNPGTGGTPVSPNTGGAGGAGGGSAGGGNPATGGAGGSGETGGAAGGGAAGAENGGTAGGGAENGGAAGAIDLGPLPKFVGNITTGWNGAMDTNGLTYSDYWDQVTPENAGKWGSVQGSPTSDFDWTTLDAIYDYATSKRIVFKQHAFLWGTQQPEPQSSITESHVKAWMNEFCSRYPATRLIDVVNEPPPHTNPGYADAIGGGTNGNWKWISNAFKWAREACPNAVLILNDYNNIEWSGDNQHSIDIVRAIQADNAPIDAIGAQSHDLDNPSVSSATMRSLVAKLHDQTGLPIYITEYDISTTDDGAQLRAYQDHIPFFMETEYILGVTIWGWIYGSTWGQARDSGLVRDGAPRSAMTWLMEELGRPVP